MKHPDLRHRTELPRVPQTRGKMTDKLRPDVWLWLSAQTFEAQKPGGNCLTDYVTMTCDLASKALDGPRHLVYLTTME